MRGSFETEEIERVIIGAVHYFPEGSELVYLAREDTALQFKKVRFIPIPLVEAAFKKEGSLSFGTRNVYHRDLRFLTYKNNRILFLEGAYLYIYNIDPTPHVTQTTQLLILMGRMPSIQRIHHRGDLITCVSPKFLSILKFTLLQEIFEAMFVKEETINQNIQNRLVCVFNEGYLNIY
jgi:hypothetical protein